MARFGTAPSLAVSCQCRDLGTAARGHTSPSIPPPASSLRRRPRRHLLLGRGGGAPVGPPSPASGGPVSSRGASTARAAADLGRRGGEAGCGCSVQQARRRAAWPIGPSACRIGPAARAGELPRRRSRRGPAVGGGAARLRRLRRLPHRSCPSPAGEAAAATVGGVHDGGPPAATCPGPAALQGRCKSCRVPICDIAAYAATLRQLRLPHCLQVRTSDRVRSLNDKDLMAACVNLEDAPKSGDSKDIDGQELCSELILIQHLLKESMGPLDMLKFLKKHVDPSIDDGIQRMF